MHNPKVVVFYSSDKEYLGYWQEIAETDFLKEAKIVHHKKHTARIKKMANTIYVVTPHPTAFGISNKFWIELGSIIKDLKE